MFKEFKAFINKGNVLEMAVGLIMATYFGAIIKSLVNDILMPPVGKMLGNIDFSKLKIIIQHLTPAVLDDSGTVITKEMPEISILYGNFINTIITFVLVAISIFFVVKAYNKMKDKVAKKEAIVEVPAEPPKPTAEEILLTEIRDLLKNNQKF